MLNLLGGVEFALLSRSRFVCSKVFCRQRIYIRNMECDDLQPPAKVRGMQKLDRECFSKEIKVPTLNVSGLNINAVLPHVKKLLLKMNKLKPVFGENDDSRSILLHPLAIKSWQDLPIEKLTDLGVHESMFAHTTVKLGYDNWLADEIFRAVLPDDKDKLNSFSRIGHIVHVNLRDHLFEYKHLIGEVLQDKVVGCKAVVHKAQNIDNLYRNFQLELLSGEPNYQVTVKENGIPFEFDFSTVYWNPRLSSEHERIVKMLRPGDVLYDVFAGVGPFAVPAAKKRCTVLANDLNPESFKWLQSNATKNKVTKHLSAFNEDGRMFITKHIRNDLIDRLCSDIPAAADTEYAIHVTMNLPAMAVEFLDAFNGLMAGCTFRRGPRPLVHVYCFAKGAENSHDMAREFVETNLGCKLTENNLESINFVRNVAPNKEMMRVSFYLTQELLLGNFKRKITDSDENLTKKMCK